MLARVIDLPKRILIFLAASALLAGSATVSAQDQAATPEKGEEPLWEWRLAAIGRYGSAYPASEEMQVNIIPLPIPIYRGKFLRLFEDAEKPIRGRIFQHDRIKLNLDLDLTFPADSDDIDVRTGMPDLDLLLQVGPELELQFTQRNFLKGHWYLALQGRGAASFDGLNPSYRGLTFSTEFRYVAQMTSRDEFKFRITPTVATSEYMEYYYQVDSQFATPMRSAYSAKGGYLGTDITLNWNRKITKDLSVWLGARLGVYSGARNEDSPLFTDSVTPSVYAAFMYKFWESKRRAHKPPPDLPVSTN